MEVGDLEYRSATNQSRNSRAPCYVSPGPYLQELGPWSLVCTLIPIITSLLIFVAFLRANPAHWRLYNGNMAKGLAAMAVAFLCFAKVETKMKSTDCHTLRSHHHPTSDQPFLRLLAAYFQNQSFQLTNERTNERTNLAACSTSALI